MARKEFISLIEENGMIVERMLMRIHQYPSQDLGYSRQQLMVLVDLAISGKSMLKEIAHRQGIPTPNLCIMFRKLEGEGLVARTVDDQDRRNTWYSVTPHGRKIVNQFRENVFDIIESFCNCLTPDEEKTVTKCLGDINRILKRVEEQNA